MISYGEVAICVIALDFFILGVEKLMIDDTQVVFEWELHETEIPSLWELGFIKIYCSSRKN